MNKLVFLFVVVFSAGCASIVSDDSYPLSVNSTPSGASFTITNKSGIAVSSGVTPQVVSLEASSGYFKREIYEIVLSKEGYDDKVFTLSSTVDGWYWGNILIGGLIGMLIVDPATGAMYKLPESVDIPLAETVAASTSQDIDLVFATVDALTAEQQSQLQAIR